MPACIVGKPGGLAAEALTRNIPAFGWMELSAHSRYTEKNYPIAYWKTLSGIEVDFILGDHEIAVEVKSNQVDLILKKGCPAGLIC